MPNDNRRLIALTGALLLTAAALGAGAAAAGTGLSPVGTVTVTAAADGSISSPPAVDLTVTLEAGDVEPLVWVSDRAEVAPSGAPQGTIVHSCNAQTLVPAATAGAFVCRVPTAGLRGGATYHWWLVHRRADGTETALSGPVTFTLEVRRPAVSRMTFGSAALLPSLGTFDGTRSVKYVRVTRALYRTMTWIVPRPMVLATACWAERDWPAVAASADVVLGRGVNTLTGFWLPKQPRWLHLAPPVCSDLELLISSGRANGRRAGALVTAIHENLHAYGLESEAQTNCYAAQLAPLAGWELGLRGARLDYLSRLAVTFTRAASSRRYWSRERCRDGGAWDLFEDVRNLTF